MYLLDSSLVAALRAPQPAPGVQAWLAGVAGRDLHVSALTAGEIQAAIEAGREGDPAAAEALGLWLDRLVATGGVLPADDLVFRTWARLLHGKSRHMSEDALIAATALVHDLTVVTLNGGYFESFEVPVLDLSAQTAAK